MTKERFQHLASAIISDREVRLVDERYMDLFAQLRKQLIPTIALTKASTGPFGQIKSFEDWRFKELRSVGIDFSGLTPLKEDGFCEKRGIRFHGFHYKVTFSVSDGVYDELIEKRRFDLLRDDGLFVSTPTLSN